MTIDAASSAPAEMPLRLAIISTPRSGNAWLRHLLSSIYAMPALSVHSPAEVDWPALPARFILQIHWHPTSSLIGQLENCQVRVLTPARHPLDVLLSILHFALFDSSTARWLEGEHGSERPIYGAMPCSAVFLDYATSKRAAALLSVCREWRARPGVWSVRYEDLVKDPERIMNQLVQYLGVPVCCPVAEAVAGQSLTRRRQEDKPHRHHYWQGTPGLWRRLLPAAQARHISDVLDAHFQALGYVCDPDLVLDDRQADTNWLEMFWEDMAEDLQNVLARNKTLAQLQADLGEVRAELQATKQALAAAQTELIPFEGLGDRAIATAQRLHRLSLRHPKLATVFRRFAGRWLKPRG